MKFSELASSLSQFMFSPIELQAVATDLITEATDGEFQLVDPSNPFVYLLEVATANAANQNAMDEVRAMKTYPKLATSWDHLYRWMYDKAYVGRFAMPGQANIILALGYQEILDRAVEIPVAAENENVSRAFGKKLVIPRNTVFKVGTIDFGLHYPIEIQVQAHDQVKVVWNADEKSPLQQLTSNRIDYGVTHVSSGKILAIKIPLQQFTTLFKEVPFNENHGMNSSIDFVDQFYHCRCWADTESGDWVELKTTHSDQIYDPLDPTIVLQVEGQQLKWRVPEIYVSTGQLSNRTIRLEVLTTKGSIHIDPSDYNTKDWKDDYLDKGPAVDTKYSAPMGNFNVKGLYSEGALSGGRSGLSFNEQRARVMAGVNQTEVPITGTQVELMMESAGYGLVTSVDNVTNRIFLATRELPKLSDTVPRAGSLMGSFLSSVDKLTESKYVVNNGDRITILPKAIYADRDGTITKLADTEIDAIYDGNIDYKVNASLNNVLYYTPFHYQLDSTGEFEVHPYYLQQPALINPAYVDANETLPHTAAVSGYTIEVIEGGFRLSLVVTGNKAWQEVDNAVVFTQLAFRPKGEGDYAYMIANGTLNDQGQRLFVFDIKANYDFIRERQDSTDAYNAFMGLTSFAMYGNNPAAVWASIQQDLEIFHVITDLSDADIAGIRHSPSDNHLAPDLRVNSGYCFYREQLTAIFAYDLDGLWSRSRVISSEIEYKRYTENIPWVYETNVNATDSSGGVIIDTNPDGSLSLRYLHKKGDLKLNSDGTPAIRYYKNDIMLDMYGYPIPVDLRKTMRNFDMFFVDASYLLANDPAVVQYRQQIPMRIIEWLANDIAAFKAFRYENTIFALYPKQSLGYIDVIVENGVETTLPAALSFNVTLYLPAKQYADLELRGLLTTMVSEKINACLDERTVAKAQMISDIRSSGGEDIINVEVDDFGPGKNLSVYTAKNDSIRCAVKKELYIKADGVLDVRESINVQYVKHAQSNTSLLAQGRSL